MTHDRLLGGLFPWEAQTPTRMDQNRVRTNTDLRAIQVLSEHSVQERGIQMGNRLAPSVQRGESIQFVVCSRP
jgi:hypothetical protein